MKRLVRNRATRAYLTAEGNWGDFRSAQHFADMPSAITTCQTKPIHDAVELVLIVGETPSEEFDIALPFSGKP